MNPITDFEPLGGIIQEYLNLCEKERKDPETHYLTINNPNLTAVITSLKSSQFPDLLTQTQLLLASFPIIIPISDKTGVFTSPWNSLPFYEKRARILTGIVSRPDLFDLSFFKYFLRTFSCSFDRDVIIDKIMRKRDFAFFLDFYDEKEDVMYSIEEWLEKALIYGNYDLFLDIVKDQEMMRRLTYNIHSPFMGDYTRQTPTFYHLKKNIKALEKGDREKIMKCIGKLLEHHEYGYDTLMEEACKDIYVGVLQLLHETKLENVKSYRDYMQKSEIHDDSTNIGDDIMNIAIRDNMEKVVEWCVNTYGKRLNEDYVGDKISYCLKSGRFGLIQYLKTVNYWFDYQRVFREIWGFSDLDDKTCLQAVKILQGISVVTESTRDQNFHAFYFCKALRDGMIPMAEYLHKNTGFINPAIIGTFGCLSWDTHFRKIQLGKGCDGCKLLENGNKYPVLRLGELGRNKEYTGEGCILYTKTLSVFKQGFFRDGELVSGTVFGMDGSIAYTL